MPKKWNIEKVKQLFEKENLTILDEKYKNNTTKLNYKDKDGYLYVNKIKKIGLIENDKYENLYLA